MIRLETDNRAAFESLNEAISFVERYNRTRNEKYLKEAFLLVEKSLRYDSNYLRAINWDIIIHDLSGQHRKVVDKYAQILSSIPKKLQRDTLYNLGAAYYHHYDTENLDKAINYFDSAIEIEGDLALKVLAKASKGQAYAMRILMGHPHHGGTSNSEELQIFYDNSVNSSNQAIKLVESNAKLKSIKEEVLWIAHNAIGMANMYLHDSIRYVLPSKQSFEFFDSYLIKSIRNLKTAEISKPRNWANWSDMGSSLWRRGLLYKTYDKTVEAETFFQESLDKFEEVVSSIRLNYDFALYEMGKVYRLMEKKEESLKYLNLAKKFSLEQRNIPIDEIETEINKIGRDDFGFSM